MAPVTQTDSDALRRLLEPRGIAVIGASTDPAKIGGRPVDYLKRFGYRGAIVPVNPGREVLQGLPCKASVRDIDVPVDLAIICVAAAQVLDAVADCAAMGITSCLVLSSGFAETGAAGAALQAKLADFCQEHGIALVGPNCVGFMVPATGVAATFTTTFSGLAEIPAGSIALISQSGAIAAHLQAELQVRGIGLSAFVTTGNEAGLSCADFIDYYAHDPRTRVVASYLEGFADVDHTLAAIRRCTEAGKPVIMLKAGISPAGGSAASSHTGKLAADGALALAALRQAGAAVAMSIDDLLDVCEVADLVPPMRGRRTAIVTISGGTGVLLADAIHQHGMAMATMTAATLDGIKAIAPPFASAGNPFDLTGRPLWQPEMIGQALDLVLADPGVDVAVLGLSSGWSEAVGGSWIQDLAQRRAKAQVPIAVAWLSGNPGHLPRLRQGGVPVFTDPMRCMGALAALAPKNVPGPASEGAGPGRPHPGPGTAHWTEAAAKAWLAERALPVPASAVAHSAGEAVHAAREIGYPVVVKALAAELAHKSALGGVLLNLSGDDAVRQAADRLLSAQWRAAAGLDQVALLVEQQCERGTEVVVAMHTDDVLGRMLAVGVGGVDVERLARIAWRRLPVDDADIAGMLADTGLAPPQPDRDDVLHRTIARFAAALGNLDASVTGLELNPVIVDRDRGTAMIVDALATTSA